MKHAEGQQWGEVRDPTTWTPLQNYGSRPSVLGSFGVDEIHAARIVPAEPTGEQPSEDFEICIWSPDLSGGAHEAILTQTQLRRTENWRIQWRWIEQHVASGTGG